jgi:hypothetical protein
MGNRTGFRRKAKYAPGALLATDKVGEEVVVLDVCKSPVKHKNLIEYYYKVYSKAKKTIQYIQPFYIENMVQVDLLNAGNLRTLLDDAANGFDATHPAPPPNPTVSLPKGLTFIPIKINLKK